MTWLSARIFPGRWFLRQGKRTEKPPNKNTSGAMAGNLNHQARPIKQNEPRTAKRDFTGKLATES
jgi:hypothetical protein